jgi:hypothetical protein
MFWLASIGIAFASFDECPVDDFPVCDPTAEWLPATEYLRALSLDLRGQLPTMDEYRSIEAVGDVPEDLIDAWLAAPEFAAQAARAHRALNLNNLGLLRDGLRMLEADLSVDSTTGIHWLRRGPHRRSVGANSSAMCTNQPASPDQPNGWVEVSPFWAPETRIKVCAEEARASSTNALGVPCGSLPGLGSSGCGCGPELRWCNPPGWHDALLAGAAGDVDRRVEAMIERDAPYMELLRGRTMYVNGPMSHFLRHQSWQSRYVTFRHMSPAAEDIPEIPPPPSGKLDDWSKIWVPVALGPEHSGVLTSTAYLLRHTSQRARAKTFFEGYRCQPFHPPAGGIPNGTSTSVNLTTRDGCAYCHATLDPAAAAWGRWTAFGSSYLDPRAFPAYSDTCYECANSLDFRSCGDCANNYLLDPVSSEQNPYVGWLLAYQFLSERDRPRVDEGPRRLVEEAVADGSLASCTARNTAERLLGRSLGSEVPEDADRDAAWLESLAVDLVASGWSYRALVKAVVMSDEYRRPR